MEPNNEGIKKVEHKNIYAALSAFQGENPEIVQSKEVEFDAGGKKVKFKYAPLDGILKVVRPLLSKHGLAITFEEGKEKNSLVAALYHESYKMTEDKVAEELKSHDGDPAVIELLKRTFVSREEGVIRSMPISVTRTGDMKKVGGDSTYARRYMVSEVLGIASDEDNDVQELENRVEKLEKFAFTKSRDNVVKSTSIQKVEEFKKYFENELALVKDNKETQLGLTEDQYVALIAQCKDKIQELGKLSVGKEVPGANHDGNGEGVIPTE
jgi:hypothetical protein